MYWLVFALIVLCLISLFLNAYFIFAYVWKDRNSKPRQIIQNTTISLFSVVGLLIFLELFFKLFFVQSDALNTTLASQNWFERYWQLNSLGYRDKEWEPELLNEKTKIMVLGDSFVAGHGIKNPQDRFPDQLNQMLGDTYAVINVGQNGASTKTEIQNALAYPVEPDIVILSFFVNDILDTANDLGYLWEDTITNQPPFLVNESYALNFLYWRLYRLYFYRPERQENNQEFQHVYDWFLSLYSNPDIWNVYQKELLSIHQYTAQRDIQLIVVIFPYLREVEKNRAVTMKVANLYLEQGVPVIDVTKLVADSPASNLIVNPYDAHPNEFVHCIVAKSLYALIKNELFSDGDIQIGRAELEAHQNGKICDE